MDHGVTDMSGAGGLWQGSALLPAFPRPRELLELESAPQSVKEGFAALARRKKAALLARNPALKALQVGDCVCVCTLLMSVLLELRDGCRAV